MVEEALLSWVKLHAELKLKLIVRRSYLRLKPFVPIAFEGLGFNINFPVGTRPLIATLLKMEDSSGTLQSCWVATAFRIIEAILKAAAAHFIFTGISIKRKWLLRV